MRDGGRTWRRRTTCLLATGLLALGLLPPVVGCGAPASTAGDRGVQQAVTPPDSSYRLSVLWRQPIALRAGEALRFSDEAAGTLWLPERGVVVVATEEGRVAGLDPASGEIRWVEEIRGGVRVRPVSLGRSVLIAGLDGTLHVLDAGSGAREREIRIGETIVGGIALHEGRLAFLTGRNALQVVDLASGQIVWSHVQRITLDVRVRGSAAPAINEQGIWAGFADGSLIHFAPGGEIAWTRDLAEGERRLRDVLGRVVVRGDTVYAASFSGGLHALDARTGVRHWRLPIEGATPPVFLDDRTLVTASAGGRVLWVDAETGRIMQELDLEKATAGVLQLAGDFLVLPAREGGLAILDARRPWVHQRFDPGDGISAPVSFRGDMLFVLSNRGIGYGVRMERAGTSRASFIPGAEPATSVADVNDGAILR